MQTNLKQHSIVYSQLYCPACVKAKAALAHLGYAVEERIIGQGGTYTKEQLMAAVPNARSVPQIFVNDLYIGGLKELREYLIEHHDYNKED